MKVREVGECNIGEDICVTYYPHHLFSLVFLPNWEKKIMWAWRDYFSPHFLSIFFSLMNQIRENSIFHPIFFSFFSILPVLHVAHDKSIAFGNCWKNTCFFTFYLNLFKKNNLTFNFFFLGWNKLTFNIFFRKFQPITSNFDDSFLSSNLNL